MNVKICNKCKKELPFENFYKQKRGKFGLQPKCKSCFREYERENKERIREYQSGYREQHKEKAKEYNKQYRKEHKEELSEKKRVYYQENKEWFKQVHKEYYFKNKERHMELGRRWYKANKEKVLAYSKEHSKKWNALNRDKTRNYCNKRRALKKGLPSTLTVEQWDDIKKHFNDYCAYCGKDKKLEQEHFVPLSKGGEFTLNNIVPACRSCNSSKQNKDFFDWYPSHESYSKQREQKILSFLNYNRDKEQQLALL